MSLPYVIRAQAEEEILEAGEYYEGRRSGLGATFFAAVRDAVLQAAESPGACAPVRGPRGLVIRALATRRFPFHVISLHEPERIAVIALAHERGRPGCWKDRVE